MVPRFALEARNVLVPGEGEGKSEERLMKAISLTAVLGILTPLLLLWIIYRLAKRLAAKLHGSFVGRRYRLIPRRTWFGAGAGAGAGANERQQGAGTVSRVGAHEMDRLPWLCSDDQAVASSARLLLSAECGPAPEYEERLSMPPPAYGTWTARRTMPEADDGCHDNRLQRHQSTFHLQCTNYAIVLDPTTSTWSEDRCPRHSRWKREG